MTRSRRLASGLAAPLVLVVLVALSACTRLPEEGPVREVRGDVAPPAGIPYLPPGPARGAEPVDIVHGFIDAMMASPIQLSTAREYLTKAAAGAWRPERRIVVYAGTSTPDARHPDVLELEDPVWIDSRGQWRGAVPGSQATVRLPLVRQDGEWRIADVPDAMLVRDSWFRQSFGQMRLYFPEPGGRVLVPEPVFVPRGEQLATALVRGLVSGPPDPEAGLLSPLEGAELAGGAVTVADGVATVAIRSGLARVPAADRELLVAQLAWTLRQVPGVASIQVRLGDAPLTLEGGLTEVPVSTAAAYDPAVTVASDSLFGLRDGVPVRLDADGPVALPGPWAKGSPLRDLALDLTATSAAGVTRDGHRVLLAPFEEGAVLRVGARGTSFARPSWDVHDRIWLLDRRPAGAEVSVLVDGRRQRVVVPGVSGEQVVDMVVSRDGTRLVAALRRGGGDVLVTSRVDWGGAGPVAAPARRIASGTAGHSMVDIAWNTPSEILVLSRISAGLSEVRSESVDGAPYDLRGGAAPDPVRIGLDRLVAAPAVSTPSWAVAADGEVLEVVGFSSIRPPSDAKSVTALTYVG